MRCVSIIYLWVSPSSLLISIKLYPKPAPRNCPKQLQADAERLPYSMFDVQCSMFKKRNAIALLDVQYFVLGKA
jgi:hypothetical protein